jgi:hypothetical protein
MQASLRTLLTGILDYAGLFPPAKLSLDQALPLYARYRQDSNQWLLGRFVIPAGRLEELQPFLSGLFASGPPLALSVLGRPANNDADFLEGLTLDLEAVAGFRALEGSRVAVEVLETRLPAGPGMVELIRESSEQAAQSELFPFFEIGLAGDWRTTLNRALHGCAAVGRAGLKLRCGGQEPTAVPSVEQVAGVIADAALARVPLKFTAGLHHPLRGKGTGREQAHHGFLNVFVAGVLAVEHQLPETTLRQLLQEETPAVFQFDDAGVRWREWHAGTAEIALARQYTVTSFGSCSFDEPLADMSRLGWL